MTLEHKHSNAFVGSLFEDVDLSGSTFRACNLAGVRIYGSYIEDMSMTGWDGAVGSVIIDDVDVTAYVASELDARFPERVQLRAASTADDFRAMWSLIAGLWAETISRAQTLTEADLNERVGGEWSFVQTLRHLTFAVDSWIDRMILGEDTAFCALGMPPGDYPADQLAEIGLDPEARPPLAEVLALFVEHQGRVRRVVESMTDGGLAEVRTAKLTPAFPEETETVAECLRIVMREHNEHRRFALRDLAALESR